MNVMEWQQTFLWILLTGLLIFFLFELGEMVTNQYEMLNAELYQCDWHSFPLEMQRMFVTFMTCTQQPVFIHGYGNTLTQCTRETLKKVIGIECCFNVFYKSCSNQNLIWLISVSVD